MASSGSLKVLLWPHLCSLVAKRQSRTPPDLFRIAVVISSILPFDLENDLNTESHKDITFPDSDIVEIELSYLEGFVESVQFSAPVDESSSKIGILRRYSTGMVKSKIRIPTVHIIGEGDLFKPASVDFCSGKASVVNHSLGHRLLRDAGFSRRWGIVDTVVILKSKT